jgi:hypothetical protein
MEIFVAAFGITAAVILIVGSLVLRQIKSRQQFLLMQQVLDKGLPGLPGLPPFWVLSMRQGVMTLTLGVGLLIVGLAAMKGASKVEMPSAASLLPPSPANPSSGGGSASGGSSMGASAGSLDSAATTQRGGNTPPGGANDSPGDQYGQLPPPPPPPGEMGPPDDGGPPPPPGDGRPGWGGPGGWGPGGGPGFGGPGWNGPPGGPRWGGRGMPPAPPRPPAPNPALERWHAAQAQHAIGLIAAGIGFILFLLGGMRIAFAGVERRHMSA